MVVFYIGILWQKGGRAIKTNGGFLITKIKQIQGRVFERCLIEHGIEQFNDAQGRILFVLWSEDNIPISELAKKTGLAKTTLTSMLDRLETARYLIRIYDKEDRRKINIRLTDTANGLKSKYEQVSEHMTGVFYEGFSDKEIRQFENFLERILDNLTRRELG
jgi:DNA-binding MarR family transcriptional regulator